MAAADDDKYWDKEARRPTLWFLAARPALWMHAGIPKNSENNHKAGALPYSHSEGGGASKTKNRGDKRKREPAASSKGTGKGKDGKGGKVSPKKQIQSLKAQLAASKRGMASQDDDIIQETLYQGTVKDLPITKDAVKAYDVILSIWGGLNGPSLKIIFE